MRLPLRPILAVWLGAVASAAAAAGCSSDHDLLAQKRDAGSFDDGGPIYGNSGGNESMPRDAGRDVGAGDPEPPGPWALTWVNGVVDEDATRVCFVPVVDGQERPPDAAPLPSGDGLPFGGKLVLDSLPGVDFAANDLHPYLVPKSAGLDPAATCKALLAASRGDADAADAPLSLPLIPAGTLSAAYSYLAVATGCVTPWPTSDVGDGGDVDAGRDAATIDAGPLAVNGDAICGPNSSTATASLVLVRLSRLESAPKLGFQVVHASAATPDAMLVFVEPLTGNTILSVGKLGFGQIAPAHDAKLVSQADLLFNAAKVSVRVGAGGAPGFPTVGTDLGDILTASELDQQVLQDGGSFTFVLIGARPSMAPSSAPYYPFDALLVPNAPPGPASDAN